MRRRSEACADLNLRWKIHLCRALGDRIFLVLTFVIVVVRDNEAGRRVVRKSPRAHILYRFFGEYRVAGQDLHVCYLMPVSSDFQLHRALQAHCFGFARVFRTLERGHGW